MKKFDISCTGQDESVCNDCNLDKHLGCRYSRRDFWFFTLNQVPFFIMAVASFVFTGLLSGCWWALIMYLVLTIVFFGLGLETRILCSHCPYWANGSSKLNCWAYPNTPKYWKYRPGPMNTIEKSLLIIFFAFIFIFPVLIMLYSIWLIIGSSIQFSSLVLFGAAAMAAGTFFTGLQFLYIMQHYFCRKCVNFSCPLNHVKADVVQAYLQKNPVMKKTWEKSGYIAE